MTTRAKHPSPSPSRVSGGGRFLSCGCPRVYSSSARLPVSACRSIDIGVLVSGAEPMRNCLLQVLVEPRCQALNDAANDIANLPKSVSPLCAVRHVQQCDMGAVRDGAQVVRA